MKNIQERIEIINKSYKYTNFIKNVSFEHLANIRPGEVLKFDFPLTALIGGNGSNKTRALQAIFGIPHGNSITSFWFDTKLDPINKDLERKYGQYRYIAECTNEKNEKKTYPIVYARTHKVGTEDYWETRTLTKEQMKKYNVDENRFNPISKKCIYIDSKVEISAHDICFYFSGRSNSDTQDYKFSEAKKVIRSKSNRIKDSIEKNKIFMYRNGTAHNTNPIQISKEVMEKVSYILDKKYDDAYVLRHKHYGLWADSIYINKRYSDARTGSGELKVFNIVRKIMSCPERSLILLDEPEISLHPGAQIRLLDFLLEQILEKKHQIIMTTHSATICRCLPVNAISVFRNQGDMFVINNNIDPISAFEFIGEPINNEKINIIVEDIVSKKLLESILDESKKLSMNRFNIAFFSCGAEDLFKLIPSYFNIQNVFIFFDGDKNYKENNKLDNDELDPNKIATEVSRDNTKYKKYLESVIKKYSNIEPKNINFPKESNMKTEIEVSNYEKYIHFIKSRVFFFPLLTPEDLLWEEKNIKMLDGKDEVIKEANNSLSKSKDKIRFVAAKLVDEEVGSQLSNEMQGIITRSLIKEFVKQKNEYYLNIEEALLEMCNISN